MYTRNYQELQKKYERQRLLYRQKRIYYSELRELYVKMGELYREYRNSYLSTWRAIINESTDPSEADSARQKLDKFLEELEDLREAISQKQQQIEEYQRTQDGWVVLPHSI